MTDNRAASLYDGYYFATSWGHPYEGSEDLLRFFAGVADRIVGDIGPASVMDAGCAIGYMVEALRGRGVEAFGVDVSEYAIAHPRPGTAPYIAVGSVTEPFPRRYDLILCVEVLEHMQKEQAEAAVANLCRHADDILFSSSPHEFKEVTHFHVRPTEYWVEQFARHGFYPDVDFDGSFLTRWALRLRKGHLPVPRVLAAYEKRRYWMEQEIEGVRATALEMRDQLAAKDELLRRKQAEVETLTGGAAPREEELRSRLAEAEGQLAKTRASLSWRLTGPIRAVLSRLRGA